MKSILISNNTNYTSKESFDALKGYLALCILVHHLSQFTNLGAGTYIGIFLNLLGHYTVVGFIFLSGFGLLTSYKVKGMTYIKEFPKKRLLPYYATYAFTVVIYYIFWKIFGSHISILQLVKSFTIGETIISFGWYLQLTLWLYIAFWILYSLKLKDTVKSVLTGLFTVLFLVLSVVFQLNILRCIPVLSFAFGFFYAYNKEKMTNILSKYRILIIPVSFAAILLRYKADNIVDLNPFVSLVVFGLADIGFIFIIMFLLMLFTKISPIVLKNPISHFLSRISKEIYMCQGLVLSTLYLFIHNTAIYITASTIAVIILALFYHKFLDLISNSIIKKR